MKRYLWLMLLCCLFLTGCQEEGTEGERMQDYVESGTPVGQTDEETPWLPQRFSLAYHEGHTLNPILCGEGAAQDVATLLYETLFALDDSFSPVPQLCSEYYWEGQSFLIRLREDVVFSDGTPMTAEDVVSSLQQAATSQRYGYRFRNVTSITADREGRVVLTLSGEQKQLPALLNIPIMKKGTLDQLVPVGSGAYTLTMQDDETMLIKNPHWWQDKTLPVDTIWLVHAKDKSTALYLLSARNISLLTVDPTEDELNRAGTVETVMKDTSILQYVGFQTLSGPCSKSTVRQAFSDGLQRQWMVDNLLSGYGQATTYPISPCSRDYPTEEQATLSPAEAVEAWTEALTSCGETPRELIFVVNGDNSFHVSCATWIADSLSTPEWPITVQALPWESYLQVVSAGTFDLYYGEVKLTADWDIRSMVGSGGALNYGGYSDSTMDTLLSGNHAEKLYAHFAQEQPIATVCFLRQAVLTLPHVVEGLVPTQDNTFANWENVSIHLADE